MTAIITKSMRVHNAEIIKNVLSGSGSDKHYVFIGKSTPWTDDYYPDTPIDSVKDDSNIRRDIFAMQRLGATDVSLGVLRRTWMANRYYDFYRHDYGHDGVYGVNLSDGSPTSPESLMYSNYYVVTDEYNVYMCLWNGGGVKSTVKPTGTSTSIFATADGYEWKYMYSVAAADVQKFVSSNFIPVKRVESNPGIADQSYLQWLVRSAAVPGTVNRILIENGGQGYPVSSAFPLNIIGDGSGIAATANTDVTGSITSVDIVSVGSGYTWAMADADAYLSGEGEAAVLNPIIAPRGGYGYDPVEQLCSHYTLIGVQIDHDPIGDFPTGNEYRRIGIIKNPKSFGTSSIATGATLNATRKLVVELSTPSEFTEDEVITGSTSGARGRVVTFESSSKLRVVQTDDQYGTFQIGETIIGDAFGASAVITNIENPDVDPKTGELIYIEHRRPVSIIENQIEIIKTVIES